MATRLATKCRAMNCPNLAGKRGYCVRHQQDYYRARLPGKRIYKTPLHQSWRAYILARDRVCKMCGQASSVIADHIIPLSRGGSWDYSNGQGLCRHCDGLKGVKERFG